MSDNCLSQKPRKKHFGKFIAWALILAVLVGLGALFGPKLLHTCDNCDSFFIGTGYRANVVSDALSSLIGDGEKVLCRSCAETSHALAIIAGKSLDDYRIPLFGEGGE